LTAFGGLALALVLSPVAAILAAVIFGVTLIVFFVRVFRGRPSLRWGGFAASSLAAALLFAGVSSIIYGGYFRGAATSSNSAEDAPGYVEQTPVDEVEPSSPELAGIDTSNPVWAFDVTCQQLEGNSELRLAVARDLAETVNSPLGPQAAIDSLDYTLVVACEGVDPGYAPGSTALEYTEDEVGDS
jgi:hypothetical protein